MSPSTGGVWPVRIGVDKSRRVLSIAFDNGDAFELPAWLLRVMTAAADERGHHTPADALEPLAIDKSGVGIRDVTPIGRYAVRIAFDDGHDTGLYPWESLHRIGRDRLKLEARHRALVDRGPGEPA